ncbi:tRNA uridine-5-carboxymethylaminomethyl(34) synthesis GTPase MnmE [Sphingomicrobium sp. XHP0239]|uniref:tRNA uridine-5-carboxymethylaminomethyl(34) synthesis GTPase MnmE n=1 Tax=Sphingomicrobium maritimum TaxID=3133972 RepID=UPI0031CC7226
MAGSTIVALSSGALPSAIAIVRLSGAGAHAAAATLCALPEKGEVALREVRDPTDRSLIDEGIVLRFDAPRSATGEDGVEFHLHGSPAIVDRVIALLVAQPDVRLAEPGEFTRRALMAGKMDLIEAEALSDLLAAETEEQRRQAMTQMKGGLSGEIHILLSRTIDLSAQVEAAIDYVGDEDEIARVDDVSTLLEGLKTDIEGLLRSPSRRPLHDGIRVVFAGPPNSGKSSLFNKIVGFDRAIVDSRPGTTRDSIEYPVRLDDRAYIFVDTAGVRDMTDDRIERAGIDRTHGAVSSADILIWFGDPDSQPQHANSIQVSPKCDLVKTWWPGVPVSSRSSDGERALLTALRQAAAQILPGPNEAVLNVRHRKLLSDILDELAGPAHDLPILASSLTMARRRFEELLGVGTLDDVLDRVFSRFCLGK